MKGKPSIHKGGNGIAGGDVTIKRQFNGDNLFDM